ncbi:Gfo/Idh/MocA family protein [Actinophytocola glycyrrhizae]|uniref:Gfo/Idh/MocA family protein n=1 Tax=Actinophytocola glycyrrhizae TaxID=2044873 RepID=A0ABV9S5T4_9PSEU
MPEPHTGRRRYAMVGMGSRAAMYVDAMLGEHADVALPVAWCDPNEARMALYDERVQPHGHAPRHYHPDDLGRMLTEENLDVVVVTSPDHTHARVVTTALDAGVDVVCEKPLTIDADGLRAIRRSVTASPAQLTVTFNYRYSPRNSALRQVIADGLVGEVLSVHFEWLLDTVHGADYFRRWHRDKRHSGGLAVHKATHHFDLVNWWIGDVPESVVALGGLRFYGESGAGRPAGPRPRRARDLAADDPFHLDMAADDRMRDLYLEAEHVDGYIRDQDVFAPGGDIEDTLSVLVAYRGGASMTYSLTAHSPWEGYRVAVNGTRGRAELEVVERSHVAVGRSAQLLGPNGKRPAVDPSVTPGTVDGSTGARRHGSKLVVQGHWGAAEEVLIPEGQGAHGGGDAILLRDVFRGTKDDPLRRQADHVDGMHSVSVGIAVNKSLESGQPVPIADLVL